MIIRIVISFILTAATSFAQPAPAKPLIIAAAASLRGAFDEIGEQFEKAHEHKVAIVYLASGTARAQIRNGAPYDVFASANTEFVDQLIEQGHLVATSAAHYAHGSIGIASNKVSSLAIVTIADLSRPEIKKIALADPAHAPYGLAAQQALELSGLWGDIQKKCIYARDIAHALFLVTSGNAEAGFVSSSIADTQKINFLPIDRQMHQAIVHAIAVTTISKQQAAAYRFVRFVAGPCGQAVLKNYQLHLQSRTL